MRESEAIKYLIAKAEKAGRISMKEMIANQEALAVATTLYERLVRSEIVEEVRGTEFSSAEETFAT